MAKRPKELDGKYIKRCYELTEARVEQDGNTIEGHAAIYGQTTNIGNWFYEIIAPGAFDRADLSDVAFYLNHNVDALPMARSRKSIPNSTMKVLPDSQGLFMSASVDIENNSDARALKSAIIRKDITGMSFSFWSGMKSGKDLT